MRPAPPVVFNGKIMRARSKRDSSRKFLKHPSRADGRMVSNSEDVAGGNLRRECVHGGLRFRD